MLSLIVDVGVVLLGDICDENGGLVTWVGIYKSDR